LSRSGRLGIAAVIVGIGVALIVFLAAAFLRSSPPTIDFTSGHQAGQPVDMTLQTVGAIGFGAHPTWVSYLTKDPASGQWVHTTLWDLPANTTINVTIDEYDSGSPLRNQLMGLVQGTSGGVMSLNGKSTSLINSNNGNGVAHTFTIPTLGINVPLSGVNGSASNFCNSAPCTTNLAHNVITFSFVTPGPGEYPWQCFVPCGLGYLYGNGGPMQSVGYMDGFLKVVS